MRKVSFALGVGFILCACGGGEEAKAPQPEPTPVTSTPATPAPTAEAPKPAPAPKPTMAELQQKAFKGGYEALNAHDAKKFASFYSNDVVIMTAGMPDVRGRDGVQAHYEKLFAAFPDAKIAPARVWMKGDVVVHEWVFTGTHKGDFEGMKASEKPVGLMGANVAWFNADGQVKEEHVYYDAGTMAAQIGQSKQKARPIPSLPSSPQIMNSTGGPEEAKNMDAVKASMAAMEAKKEADWLATLSDDAEWNDNTMPEGMKGKDAAKKWFQQMNKAFPDGKMNVTNSWAIGDFVIREGNFTGTHKAAFMGIPPTKKAVNMHGLDIMMVKDGKLAKGWSYGNSMEMMTQLGLVKAPKADAKADAKAGDAKAGAAAGTKTDAKAGDTKAGAAAGTKTDTKAGDTKAGAKPADKK